MPSQLVASVKSKLVVVRLVPLLDHIRREGSVLRDRVERKEAFLDRVRVGDQSMVLHAQREIVAR